MVSGMRTTMAALLGLAIAVPGAASAQESLPLRYVPVLDLEVRRDFQTVTRVDADDGRSYERADLGVMRSIALERADRSRVVHMTYDSARVRARGQSGRWVEFAVPQADSAWLQVEFDSRLQVRNRRGRPAPVAVTDFLAIFTGLPNLVLPERALRVGEGWSIVTDVPASALVEPTTDPTERIPTVRADAEIVLDSIVARARDTLGFFSVSGRLRRAVSVSEGVRLEVTGDLAGRLVWSTGWNGFVSAVNRVRARMSRSVADGDDDRAGRTVTVAITMRHRVRP